MVEKIYPKQTERILFSPQCWNGLPSFDSFLIVGDGCFVGIQITCSKAHKINYKAFVSFVCFGCFMGFEVKDMEIWFGVPSHTAVKWTDTKRLKKPGTLGYLL